MKRFGNKFWRWGKQNVRTHGDRKPFGMILNVVPVCIQKLQKRSYEVKDSFDFIGVENTVITAVKNKFLLRCVCLLGDNSEL